MAYLVELIVPRARNASRFARLQQVLDQNGMSVDDVMFSVSPSCDEMLVMCRWKRQRCAQCSDLFRKVRTAYGYCCSFNYADRELDSITWRPRSRGCVGPTVPVVHRTSSCGFTNGLSVAVHVKPGEYFSSLVPSYSVM
ncbi:sodium channel protein Nach-like, partial [Frankliniella occidentalis]|uniref:Sodium channel protein Nach-like n=1 Tax=Frankliniella occidentalis TaxID=133901 RepID=A0A9C6XVU6_FRAOC